MLVVPGAPALATAAPVVVVPLDDRPVTQQLPVMLGSIAGIPVLEPPRSTIGHYLQPGDPQAIAQWLASPQTRDADAFVLSTDMLVYGGLVASRVPGLSVAQGYSRLRDVAALRALRPNAAFFGFGTIMRLAPTGVPKIGAASTFFAAGEATDLIAEYANLPDPPQTPAQIARAKRLQERLGPLLDQYIGARRRNLDVDLQALRLTAEGGFDRIVLGQDDAGQQGLDIPDIATLSRARARWGWGLAQRMHIEPGADELAMIMEAAAFARRAFWTPRVSVTWSQPGGPKMTDGIEFAPWGTIVDEIIGSCGGTEVQGNGDIALFVRVRGTSDAQETAFLDAIGQALDADRLVTVVDLTFFGAPYAEQRALVEQMIARKYAGRLAGFASWNTTANSVGTAIPAAIAVGAGKRLGTFDQTALAEFLLDRYADDYAFHNFVRPALNDELHAQKVATTYLLPGDALRVGDANRALLWPHAVDLLSAVFPDYRDEGLTITLPWDRTFETYLDVRLGPR